MTNRNCLSTWYPRLLEAGLPVPRTVINWATMDLSPLCDGKTPEGFQAFLDGLHAAALSVGGYPAFLRTGQGAGKHQWRDTCHVANQQALAQHVANLVEWSHMVHIMGLPHDVWCVRELLPVNSLAILDAYGNMPLVPEWRFFIRDGKVICRHHYWPAQAICEGFRIEPEGIGAIITDVRDRKRAWSISADQVSEKAAEVFAGDGAWSVDLLLTWNGWYVTDMADAGQSFHWPGCPNAKGFR